MLDQSYNVEPERTTIVSQALAAAASGLAVFPLAGKVPLTRNGFKNASTNAQKITAMFNAAPDATGYGIATGAASGIIVVDVDGPEAVDEAKRQGLTSGYVVKTGRPEGGGFHLYFTLLPGTEVKSRDLAPNLELKAERCYVVGAGSRHPKGAVYRVVRDGKPSPAPEWLTEPPKALRGQSLTPREGYGTPVVLDVAGPPIPEGQRNTTLTSIAGRLHDGTRTLDTLTRDLQDISDARCVPPLAAEETSAIAKSIHGRSPCKPAPTITPRVEAAVAYLSAVRHAVKGMGGATHWSVYRAGLAACSELGQEHPEGVTLSLDVRSWAQRAGTSKAAVSRHVRRSSLMRIIRRGTGQKSATVLFRVPDSLGHLVRHSSTSGVSLEHRTSASVSPSALLRTLERLRFGPGRIGKSRAALLHALVECPGSLSRAELASRLGRKPASLRAPLRWLVDAELLERISHGVYALPADFARRIEDAREIGREPEADRLQIARHANQRDAFALAWARGDVISKERRARRDRDRIRPEERAPSGTIAELERVPEPAPALVDALALYLERNPREARQEASYLALTLWAYDRVTGKPTREAVEAALAVLECENRAIEKRAKGA
jgi:hypothetical protein